MSLRIGKLIAIGALLLAGLLTSAADAATLYISEFQAGVSPSGTNSAQIIPQTNVAAQTVALSGTSGASSAFNTKTHFVRLICDEGCSVKFGTTAPTAVTTDMMLQQGQEYLFGVSPGWFVAGIANAAGNIPGGGGGTSDVNVADWGGAATSLGQKTMAASVPVVIASDQSTLTVALAASSAVIGHVIVDSGTITTVTTLTGTTTLTPGTAATNLGKAEDAVHGSGDTGVMALGVATDGSTALAAAGDYSVIGTDTAGNVRIVGPVASGATAVGNPLRGGCVFNSTMPTVTTGQIVDCQATSFGIPVLGQQTTGADGQSNNLVMVVGGSAGSTQSNRLLGNAGFLFNNSTWDRVRSVITGTDSIGTGIQAVGLLAQLDDTSPSTVTENQFGNVRLTPNRSLMVAQPVTQNTTTITRPSDTNAYAANDALSDSTSAPTAGGFTLTGACAVSGGNGTINSAIISASAGTLFQGELWVFNQAVTAVNDNAAFTVSDSDVQNLVAVIPFATTDVTAANSVSYVQNIGQSYNCVGTANLRFLVKIMAAVTPASAEVLAVRVQVQN